MSITQEEGLDDFHSQRNVGRKTKPLIPLTEPRCSLPLLEDGSAVDPPPCTPRVAQLRGVILLGEGCISFSVLLGSRKQKKKADTPKQKASRVSLKLPNPGPFTKDFGNKFLLRET